MTRSARRLRGTTPVIVRNGVVRAVVHEALSSNGRLSSSRAPWGGSGTSPLSSPPPHLWSSSSSCHQRGTNASAIAFAGLIAFSVFTGQGGPRPVDGRSVHEEGFRRNAFVLLARACSAPREMRGGIGDGRRSHGRAASCRVECCVRGTNSSKGGGPSSRGWATRLGTRHIRLGTCVRSVPPLQQGPTIRLA